MCWLQDIGAAQAASLQAVCFAFLPCTDVLSTHSVCLSCRRESEWCSAMRCDVVLMQTVSWGLRACSRGMWGERAPVVHMCHPLQSISVQQMRCAAVRFTCSHGQHNCTPHTVSRVHALTVSGCCGYTAASDDVSWVCCAGMHVLLKQFSATAAC
jgi:hypothetical protein